MATFTVNISDTDWSQEMLAAMLAADMGRFARAIGNGLSGSEATITITQEA